MPTLQNNSKLNIIYDGLWRNNQALVALLGMCSMLAVTTSAINGLGMGLAATAVLTASNATISAIRHFVLPEIRLPIFVIVIASFVTTIELIIQAWFNDLYQVLGIFIPLIVVNCIIIARAEAFASKNSIINSIIDGLATGMGFTLVLITLGGLREFAGQGTLFAQAHIMFGEYGRNLSLSIGPNFHGALIAILPPGGFFGLGFLIAIRNILNMKKLNNEQF